MFPDGTHVSAGVDTLMRRAPMTIADYMRDAVRFIDEQFGEGYAKQNPTLVAAFIQASAQDFHTAMMKVAAQDLGGDLGNVSMAIEALATAVSAAG
jgi:hypothetical protein